jgi:hypothetical protein
VIRNHSEWLPCTSIHWILFKNYDIIKKCTHFRERKIGTNIAPLNPLRHHEINTSPRRLLQLLEMFKMAGFGFRNIFKCSGEVLLVQWDCFALVYLSCSSSTSNWLDWNNTVISSKIVVCPCWNLGHKPIWYVEQKRRSIVVGIRLASLFLVLCLLLLEPYCIYLNKLFNKHTTIIFTSDYKDYIKTSYIVWEAKKI